MNGPNPEKILDPSYFYFGISQVSIKRNSDGYSQSATPIEYEFWGDKFPHVDKNVYDIV